LKPINKSKLPNTQTADKIEIPIERPKTGRSIPSTSGESEAQTLLSAEPSDPTKVGKAQSQTFLLVLSGVPSSITEGNTLTYTNVGSVTVEIIELTP
jgi:hypothetical protein